MFFCVECCVLSGKGLCDELITRPEESYRPWCVVVCLILMGSLKSCKEIRSFLSKKGAWGSVVVNALCY
jgi:hypothetical protein